MLDTYHYQLRNQKYSEPSARLLNPQVAAAVVAVVAVALHDQDISYRLLLERIYGPKNLVVINCLKIMLKRGHCHNRC